jgi:hypothetical protein
VLVEHGGLAAGQAVIGAEAGGGGGTDRLLVGRMDRILAPEGDQPVRDVEAEGLGECAGGDPGEHRPRHCRIEVGAPGEALGGQGDGSPHPGEGTGARVRGRPRY